MKRWPFQSGWWVIGALILLAILPYRRAGFWALIRGGWTLWTAILAVGWWGRALAGALACTKSAASMAGIVASWIKVAWPLAVVALLAPRKLRPPVPAPVPTPPLLACAGRLESDVRALAAGIGERHAWGRPVALAAAADYIAGEMSRAGWDVKYETFGVPLGPGRTAQCVNVVAERLGTDSNEWVIVGAHYDTAEGTPGANDNASGVAVLLELMRRSKSWPLRRSLRFVAFANEEPPFFLTQWMGSEVHARSALERGERISAMIALETMGFFSDEPGTQRYPLPLFNLWFPGRGNFVALVGNLGSAHTIARAARRLSRATELPVHWAALPAVVTGVAWSDHYPFFRRGIPAFMVTDTAPFRYPWYHMPGDTPEKLDYVRLASLSAGLEALLRDLVCASPQ